MKRVYALINSVSSQTMSYAYADSAVSAVIIGQRRHGPTCSATLPIHDVFKIKRHGRRMTVRVVSGETRLKAGMLGCHRSRIIDTDDPSRHPWDAYQPVSAIGDKASDHLEWRFIEVLINPGA